jgi:hypothetical protein
VLELAIGVQDEIVRIAEDLNAPDDPIVVSARVVGR